MDQLTTSGGDLETSVVKIAFPHQVMTEKWMLVLLIVGCTSLVFLICFPIDFYLYRRRKRLVRERKNLTMYRPQQASNRAAQYHAKVTVTNVSAEIDYSKINEIEQRKYRAQRGVTRFLSMLRKKSSAEALEFRGPLPERSLSESSDLYVKTMQEIETETPDNHGNIYNKMNDNIHNITHCVNELTGSSEEKNTHCISYVDDYFEYSHNKMFSSVSKARNENQEFFNYKKKTSLLENCYDKTLSQLEANHVKKKSHLGVNHEKETSRLGALEPLENTINVLGETRNRHRFTIPICRRNEEHLEPVNIVDETYKDVIHNTDKNRKEVVFAMSSATKLTGDDADILTHDYKNRGFSTEKACKDVLSDTALLFQTVSDADDKRFKNKKTLTHSQSEQCLSGHFSNSKRSHRNGRKHNVVSPVSKDTFIFSEMQNEGNYLNERTNDISIPIISEYSVTSKVKRRKRKPFGKKHCSDSMIELHYEKEKY